MLGLVKSGPLEENRQTKRGEERHEEEEDVKEEEEEKEEEDEKMEGDSREEEADRKEEGEPARRRKKKDVLFKRNNWELTTLRGNHEITWAPGSGTTPCAHPSPPPYSHHTVTTQSPHSHHTVTTQSPHEKPWGY